ncbi:dynactin subunit 2-like [Choristoneura fumiferana]|uniref:dynactin subunit 2-like n=1 Tax=Choristoneura fumiferana TaxID=7141 RepID=UPI003D156DF3
MKLEGAADADWASCAIDRRSVTGYVFTYGGTPISWEAKKQRTVALSTAEAEYMALTEASKEAIYQKNLLNELNIKTGIIDIYNDNQAAQNSAFGSDKTTSVTSLIKIILLRAGEYELAAEGEPETVLEKFNRLRCEFSELLEQVAEQQNKATESEKDEYSRLATQINVTKKILEELKLEEGEHIDPKAEKLKEYLASGAKKQPGVATATLKLRPEVNLAATARIAQLEHSNLNVLNFCLCGQATLCGAAATLAARAALLRPGELAAAEARVGSLLANVEALKAARNDDPELHAKVNELHKLVQQIDGISHSEILERMEALEALHNQASNFGKSLTELETLQSTISSGVQNNKELLQGVQEVFAHNIDSLQKELKKLDERIGKLATLE